MKTEKKPETVYYAFWRYDQFPYVLWAKVVETAGGGYVKTNEYGGIIPMTIIPEKKALELIKKLQQIKNHRQNILDGANHFAHQMLKLVVPWKF